MANANESTVPLISTSSTQGAGGASSVSSPWASLVNSIYAGASNLANLLPTGTFLAFSAIAPIVTNYGVCNDAFEFGLTVATVVIFGLFCVISCFTDSYQAADGKVYYGFVTLKGLWTPQVPVALQPRDKSMHKLTFMDPIYALLSLSVFSACALMTPNIRSCLFPHVKENVVRIVPAFVGFFVSAIVVSFPSPRHGIGFPVSPATSSTAQWDITRDQQP